MTKPAVGTAKSLSGRLVKTQAKGKGKIGMDDQAGDLLDLEMRAAKLLRNAHDLPPGPERRGFIEEIEQFITRLCALKAKK